MKLIAAHAHSTGAEGLNETKVVQLANTEDPRALALTGVGRIDLNFPKFTDGRAFSQAFLLRRRLGFKGEIRATGDVLIDQLVQMERTGFDTAVLREDQNLDFAQAQFDRYRGFYQGDAVTVQPVFSRTQTHEVTA
ncbi:MAG: DUF934 domain-containing protein [Burkholderiales bacterium]|nr:DUF934 domain-containing protein [Burkholderiales bacterium]